MPKSLNIQLITIDPQHDFLGYADGRPFSQNIDGKTVAADLPVFGAVEDMDRLTVFVDKHRRKISDWHVTLDSHHELHVGHAGLWVDSNGKHPGKFTIISAADIKAGVWSPVYPELRKDLLDYAVALESTPSNYRICIWSEVGHCLIGTWGHSVYAPLRAAMQRWALSQGSTIDFVPKGSNWRREHYGALMAEVPDHSDPSSGLNTEFLQNISTADVILLSGEASSHCTLKTLEQIVANIGAEHLKKIKVLTDCMSPVAAIPGLDFPAIAKKRYAELASQYGLELTTTADFFA